MFLLNFIYLNYLDNRVKLVIIYFGLNIFENVFTGYGLFFDLTTRLNTNDSLIDREA